MWHYCLFQLPEFQQNLTSWQNWEWRFRSSGTWCCVTGPVVFSILNGHSALSSEALFDPEDKADPRRLWFLTSALFATVVLPNIFFKCCNILKRGNSSFQQGLVFSVASTFVLLMQYGMVISHNSAKQKGSVQSGASSNISALFSNNELKGRAVIAGAREASSANYTDAENYKF